MHTMKRSASWMVTAALVATLFGGCAASPEDAAVEEQPDLVERAATIALEIEAAPEATEEILERHGLDVEEFEEMLMTISEDEELRKAYNARLGG